VTIARNVNYLLHFFICSRVYSRDKKLDGIVVELVPKERMKILWEDSIEEWVDVRDDGTVHNIGRIVEWEI